ncbi:MAG: hypothetical protein AAGA11_18420 [Pseudomonadota bacterium]
MAPHQHTQGTSTQGLFASVFIACFAVALFMSLILPLFGFSATWGGLGHDGYLELGRNILAGNGFRFSPDGPPAFHRPPLFPTLIAPLTVFGETGQKVGIALVNSLFVAIACYYVHRTALLLFSHHTVANAAIVLLLLNPWLHRLISSPLSAVMQMALFTAVCFYMLRLIVHVDTIRMYSWRQTFWSGLRLSPLFVAFCYAHGTSFYICMVFLTLTVVASAAMRMWRVCGAAVLVGILTATVLSPWALRNEAILDRLEPVTSGAGYTYFLSNQYWGVFDWSSGIDTDYNRAALRAGGVTEDPDKVMQYWGVIDPEADATLRQSMLDHIKTNPLELVQKAVLSFADILFPVTHVVWCKSVGASGYCPTTLDEYQTASRVARTLYMLAIVGMAIASVWCGMRQALWAPAAACALALFHTVPYWPIATYAHHGIYSLGSLPLLNVLAAATLVRLWRAQRPVTVAL